MTESIYSDLWAEILVSECGDKRIYIHQGGFISSKALILENLLCAKKLRDYLDKIIKAKENKEYFKQCGEKI